MTAPGAFHRQGAYVIVSPVRNEERNLEATIGSVAQQTMLPVRWVIVDDGSTDRTSKILEQAARAHPWVSTVHRPDRGYREPGGGVVAAFYDGYDQLQSADWQFLVKLDGDLLLPADYFEKCLEEFRQYPKLGIGGGALYHIENGARVIESNPRFHVRGATKIYRRECWEAIGGLHKAPGWDTLDEAKAQMLGWSTWTFSEPRGLHLRPTGAADGPWRDAVKNGRANYVSGYHPAFMVLKCIKRLADKPYGVIAAGLLYGFVTSYLKRLPQVNDAALIRYIRLQQIRRLFLTESIWR
jgi:biofilm PGA synthesis N-glycosyltransferase PgaC